ncbi:hypothetical protein ACSBR2_023934 [Camellia fascicularis]
MVAIRNSGRDLYNFVEPYYHVSEYRLTYVSSITPIPTVEKPPFNIEDFVIHPPVVKQPPGRPKKKRIPSRGKKCSKFIADVVNAWETTTERHVKNQFSLNFM